MILTQWLLRDLNTILGKQFQKLVAEVSLVKLPQDLADVKSTSVQVMAGGRQAPSHYLS